jgi:hypothetical protein
MDFAEDHQTIGKLGQRVNLMQGRQVRSCCAANSAGLTH